MHLFSVLVFADIGNDVIAAEAGSYGGYDDDDDTCWRWMVASLPSIYTSFSSSSGTACCSSSALSRDLQFSSPMCCVGHLNQGVLLHPDGEVRQAGLGRRGQDRRWPRRKFRLGTLSRSRPTLQSKQSHRGKLNMYTYYSMSFLLKSDDP